MKLFDRIIARQREFIEIKRKSEGGPPVHPGEILRDDYIRLRNKQITALALCVGISRKGLYAILNEKARITPKMALKLARILNTSPWLWINLQMEYDLWHAKQELGFEDVSIVREETA